MSKGLSGLDIKSFLPHLTAIIIFLLACFAYFSPQLQGKMARQGDIIQWRSMAQEVRKHEEETGKKALWTNAMFGGMPTYQINTVSAGNQFRTVDRIASLGFKGPIGRFFVAMLGFYILMILLGANSWLAIIGAIAFGFTTNNLILYEAGHETKLKAIGHLPLVAAGILLAFRKKYLLGAGLFAFGLGLNIQANHVQMTYYFFITLLILGIAQGIKSFKEKELSAFGKAIGVLIIGGLLAIGSASSNLWITYEYAQDTMRGEPILETQGTPTSSSETKGLEWGYAMNWSNNLIDVVATFIPGVAGGGSGEPVGKDSAVAKDLRRKGARIGDDFRAPLYWGALPFTSGPNYFGAVMLLFFLMGLFLVKGPMRWWIGLGTLITILFSMGKHMELVNRFFFDYVPLFNKFRSPNSVLGVTAFIIPILGILGLHNIISNKVSKDAAFKALKISAGILGVIALFFALLGSSFFDMSHASDPTYVQRGFDLDAIVSDRQSLMRSDSFRTLLLVLLSAGLIWAYLKDKLKLNYLLIGIAVLVVFDMWTVGRRYLDNELFVDKREYFNNFRPRPVDEQILQDKDLSYRVYDATVNTFNSASTSYFHKTIGGYHPAKLQRFQDMIDYHIGKGSQKVLDMFNTRYFILNGQDGKPRVQRNPGAMGNAWLVSNLQWVSTPNEEIETLNDIDPKQTAVIHEDFRNYVEGLTPSAVGEINMTAYEPDYLTYSSNTNEEGLAVFSEVWYGPNKGWQAYIDGEAVDHIRVNYILRALRLPAGNHTIEFKFEPKLFARGKMLSLLFSSIIILGFLGYLAFGIYKRASDPALAVVPGKTDSGKAVKGKRTARKKK